MKPARMSCTRNSIEPLRIDPPGSVLYKDRIKVSRHRFLNFPLYDATTKRVRTPNLKNLWTSWRQTCNGQAKNKASVDRLATPDCSSTPSPPLVCVRAGTGIVFLSFCLSVINQDSLLGSMASQTANPPLLPNKRATRRFAMRRKADLAPAMFLLVSAFAEPLTRS